MTNTKTLLKTLLGATALTVFATGTAQAQDKTLAGTTVSNTFTLDYNVGGVAQPQIDSSGDPTEFTVDRLVDLTVTSINNTTVVPSATDQELVFSVVNEGNDTQAYALSLIEEDNTTVTLDTFDTDNPTNATPLVYYVEAGNPNPVFDPAASTTVYDPNNPPELAPDEILWVVVSQDIPTTVVDTDQAHVTLLARTFEPNGAPGSEVQADNNTTNELEGVAENVLADGPGTATGDAASDGDHSATGVYIVASADITGEKVVSIHNEDGVNCNVIPGSPTPDSYSIPGACVEYVITVQNTGSADATDVVVLDTLPDELTFVSAQIGGDFTGVQTFTPAFPAASADCAGGACVIELSPGTTLPAPTGATPSEGTVTIRALLK